MWTKRDLSLYGKIAIIKTFGISQLVFPLTNLPEPPKETTKRIEQNNFAFLWDHKPDNIKRIIMYKSYTLLKWNSDLNLELQTTEFLEEFTKLYKATISTTLRSFQYRFLHRVVKTNTFAYKIGVTNSPLCTFCEAQDESLLRLFYECPVTNLFLHDVCN